MNQNKLGKIFNVSGKVVILTGAAGRVGSHFSKVLAEAGANLVLIDIDKKITELEKMLTKKDNSKILCLKGDITKKSDVIKFSKKIQKEFEQIDGEKYHYRTVLTDVAAMALEQAANKSVFELMDEHIWQKLKPENDAHVVTDPGGFPYFGAGMNASARDLGRFGLMLLNNGEYQGEQIIPTSWIEDTIIGDAGYKQRFADSEHGPMMPSGHYKNKMWVVDENILLCIGIHGQFICVNKETNSVIVRFSSQPEPLDLVMFANTLEAIQTVSSQI